MKFATRFNPAQGSTIDQTGEVSLTVQSEADSCDINTIMERFNRTGKLPTVQTLPPRYGDARVVDFATAQQIVQEAKDQFNQLSAETRKYFRNDPQAFLEAINDPSEENAKALLKLGILVPQKPTVEDTLNEIASNTRQKEITSDQK